jgi:poly-gamma-glutamate synthesis protein (capsule biosynthesis protein)
MIYAGIGHTLDAARLPVYMDSGRGSVGLVACCATFAPGQEAGLQRSDMQGRPGVTPLRVDTMHEVTEAQFACLRTIAAELGSTTQLEQSIQLGFSFPPEPGELSFLGAQFRVASRAAIRRTPHPRDVAAMAQSVRDARARADVVLFSLHVHDQTDDPEQPADYVQSFAREMIQAGSDVVAVHGPHLLRGMELYRGRPIFYSLGNLFAQNELVAKLPADSYAKFRVSQERSAAELYHLRSDGDRRGFGAERRYWESILPVCRFADGRLESVIVYPVCLRYGEAVHRRGRPLLAQGEAADAVLARFARLSAQFDVRVERANGRATVLLGEVA